LNFLRRLEANGSTALGPALLLSIQIAAAKQSSQVILCTDGLANHGFGNLEENLKSATMFYDELSEMAMQKGVSVSIITLKGTGCKLSVIGKLPEYTNGYVNIQWFLFYQDPNLSLIKIDQHRRST
jgi:hypothetical protein